MHLCTITRKNRINPGTRYRSRGLNDQVRLVLSLVMTRIDRQLIQKFNKGGPGNECECELIMWTGAETHIQVSSIRCKPCYFC